MALGEEASKPSVSSESVCKLSRREQEINFPPEKPPECGPKNMALLEEGQSFVELPGWSRRTSRLGDKLSKIKPARQLDRLAPEEIEDGFELFVGCRIGQQNVGKQKCSEATISKTNTLKQQMQPRQSSERKRKIRYPTGLANPPTIRLLVLISTLVLSSTSRRASCASTRKHDRARYEPLRELPPEAARQGETLQLIGGSGQPAWTHDNDVASFIGNSIGTHLDSTSNQQIETAALHRSTEPPGSPRDYFPSTAFLASQPTTPSMSRQIMPPHFYELGLASVGALQMEPTAEQHNFIPLGSRAAGARTLSGFNNYYHQTPPMNATERSLEFADEKTASGQPEPETAADTDQQRSQTAGSDGGKNKAAAAATEQPVAQNLVDKTIEPRQRRRMFNRILKKAEWNHLFVELSKVFLRYFLDLALKDIIGKQSGASDSTTSRKKLDAQSELADLLKDFVKTAISNI